MRRTRLPSPGRPRAPRGRARRVGRGVLSDPLDTFELRYNELDI